jgi:hypothetical protein
MGRYIEVDGKDMFLVKMMDPVILSLSVKLKLVEANGAVMPMLNCCPIITSEGNDEVME